MGKKGNGPYLDARIEGDVGIIRWLDVPSGPAVAPVSIKQVDALAEAPIIVLESASESGLLGLKDGLDLFTVLVKDGRFKVFGDETVMALTKTKPIITGARNGNLALAALLAELEDRELIVDNTTAGGGSSVGDLGLRIATSLTGAIDSVNTVFTTAHYFTHTSTIKETFYVNGIRQRHGSSNDYVASESSPGDGFDTITMEYPPRPGDVLLLDYYEDLP